MKIRLYAFGDKLMSREVLDIPENSGPRWKMVLTNPITAICGYEGQEIASRPSFNAVCEFEWIGKFEMESGAKIYNLVDILKN